MNSNEADQFDPEHLERWQQVSRKYLFAPLAEARCEAATGESSHYPVAQGRMWLIILSCAWLPLGEKMRILAFVDHFYGKANAATGPRLFPQ